jgi:hypothetical protein
MQRLLDIQHPGDKLTARVREEMLRQGFSLLRTSGFYADDALLRLKRARMVLQAGGKGWKQFPGLSGYRYWLQSVLGQALPEERLSFTALEFRHEPDGYLDGEVDRLHADGSYLRTVFTLYGLSTIYRLDGSERSVPLGRTLFMTAQDRTRAVGPPCTLHRRPGAGPERALIVCSFEPARQF